MGDNNHWQRIRSPAAAGARETKPTNTYQDNRSSWWDYTAGVSGLAVLFGALVYALGLVVLWVPIWRALTHDLGTAWHATFLVPRAVVAGLGIRQLVAFPLIAALLILAWMVTLRRAFGVNSTMVTFGSVIPLIIAFPFFGTWYLLSGHGPLSEASHRWLFWFVLEAIVVVALVLYLLSELQQRVYKSAAYSLVGVLLFGFVAYLIWAQELVPGIHSLQTLSGAIGALFDTISVALAAALVYVHTEKAAVFLTARSTEGASKPEMLPAFIRVTVVAFIGAFLLTIPSTPPLPGIEIDGTDTDKDKDVTGRLLAHTDTFWYVFEDKAPGSSLTAIPDGEVQRAWVSKANE